jgi:hypothetical protein
MARQAIDRKVIAEEIAGRVARVTTRVDNDATMAIPTVEGVGLMKRGTTRRKLRLVRGTDQTVVIGVGRDGEEADRAAEETIAEPEAVVVAPAEVREDTILSTATKEEEAGRAIGTVKPKAVVASSQVVEDERTMTMVGDGDLVRAPGPEAVNMNPVRGFCPVTLGIAVVKANMTTTIDEMLLVDRAQTDIEVAVVAQTGVTRSSDQEGILEINARAPEKGIGIGPDIGAHPSIRVPRSPATAQLTARRPRHQECSRRRAILRLTPKRFETAPEQSASETSNQKPKATLMFRILSTSSASLQKTTRRMRRTTPTMTPNISVLTRCWMRT